MKILVLSDVECKSLWDHFTPEKVKHYDLILSCGDLNPHYLSLLATFSSAPVLYVHGNHDSCYEKDPPEGCFCIEDSVFTVKGLRIAGLGGSMRYKPGTFQYSEKEMSRRVHKLKKAIRREGGVDILVTHSPAKDLNDGTDLPHQGFCCFYELLNEYSPAYFFHGHVHLSYSNNLPRHCSYKQTQVINAYEKYELEIPDPVIPTIPTWKLYISAMRRTLLGPNRPF